MQNSLLILLYLFSCIGEGVCVLEIQTVPMAQEIP